MIMIKLGDLAKVTPGAYRHGQSGKERVDLSNRFPKIGRRNPGMFLEVLDEVGRIIKTQPIADLINIQTRIHQQPLGFQDNSLLNH